MIKRIILCVLAMMPAMLFGQITTATNKPLIGVSCSNPGNNSSTRLTYTNSVIKAGGIPLLIPITQDSLVLQDILKRIDGIVMIGGEDIHPSYFGEEPIPELGSVNPVRDVYDIALIKMAHDMNIPMLGICRGEQLINVAFGGSLYQDIPAQYPDTTVSHRQSEPSSVPTHLVKFDAASKIAKVMGITEMMTNTHHHQAVKAVAPGYKATAWATDSIIEAIESSEEYPVWGVQFHPEALTVEGDEVSARLFHFFVKKASTYRKAKEIHSRIYSLDSHTDTPLRFKGDYNIGNRERTQVSLPKMEEGFVDGQYLACWVAQGKCDDENRRKAVERVNKLLAGVHRQVEMNKDKAEIAVTLQDLYRIKDSGKKAFFIGIENAYGVGNSINDIKRVQQQGVTYITLCHSRNNDYCDSSSDSIVRWNGLSPLGKKAVQEMNRCGMIIDVSHASEKTFWDVVKLSRKPIIASHSSARALMNHDRNLTDEQLRAVTGNGGVVQVCFVDEYLREDKEEASLTDFMNHLYHVIKIAGIDHVGIGTDFDGGGGVKGCRGDNDLINITVRLLEDGYSEEDISKIWGGNFLRVMSEVQKR